MYADNGRYKLDGARDTLAQLEIPSPNEIPGPDLAACSILAIPCKTSVTRPTAKISRPLTICRPTVSEQRKWLQGQKTDSHACPEATSVTVD